MLLINNSSADVCLDRGAANFVSFVTNGRMPIRDGYLSYHSPNRGIDQRKRLFG